MKYYMIPDLSRKDESLSLARRYGLGFEYNDFFDPDLLDDPVKLRERIDTCLSLGRTGDTLHGPFFDISLDSRDPGIRKLSFDRCRQAMEIGRELQVKGVVFHTNYVVWMTRDPSYCDRWVERSAKAYLTLAGMFPELRIYIENMFDDSPGLLGKLIRTCQSETGGDRIQACLDVAHASLSSTPLDLWFDELSPLIGHLHLNDNDQSADLHQTIGQGKIDFAKVFGRMKELPDKTSALIEISDLAKTEQSVLYIKKGGYYGFTQ